MVSLVPRVNSLAMSGTPARTDIKDLMGSLRFLRVPVLPYDARLWHRLQQPSMRPAFEGIFRELSVRTTKKEVAGEFSLPAQSRFVVPIELSEIELTYYNDTLLRQRDMLRLPEDVSEARPDDWVLDRALFRSCLKTLRQICTHLQVGQMVQAGPRGYRLQLGRELVTMGQALEKMREEQTQAILLESRNQVGAAGPN
jgi:E3 ubiquitin-protein ligase SHPRH